MWALIENKTVMEITDIDPDGRFHPDLAWVPCHADVRAGWLFAEGVFTSPPVFKHPVPSTCTPAQGLVALFALKRITEDDVLAAIANIPDEVQRYTVKIGYQRATTWERGSPAMQTMAELLQLSEGDLDELFDYAAGVAV